MKFVIFTTLLLVYYFLSINANAASDQNLFESKEDSYLFEEDTDYITHKEFCMGKFFRDETYCYIFKIRGIEKKHLSPVKVILTKHDSIQDISKLNSKDVLVTVHMKNDIGTFPPNIKETIRSLEWIQDNIHTYGGDKLKVTLCYYPEDTSISITMKEYLNEKLFYKVVIMNPFTKKVTSNVLPETFTKNVTSNVLPATTEKSNVESISFSRRHIVTIA